MIHKNPTKFLKNYAVWVKVDRPYKIKRSLDPKTLNKQIVDLENHSAENPNVKKRVI